MSTVRHCTTWRRRQCWVRREGVWCVGAVRPLLHYIEQGEIMSLHMQLPVNLGIAT